MIPHRRILVASPIEPSGASWLLNCFLELGIRIDHKPVVDRAWRASALSCDPGRMWIARHDGRVALHPKAGALKKFLPALAHQAEFRFRDDVSVEYVQDFPAAQPEDRARVLMVRDPRDAFYSAYRRGAPALTFEEFLRFPNAVTLLDRPAHWALFVAAWLSLPGTHVVRFEKYKRDADATLRGVLNLLGLAYADRDIARAVRLSSFERAREAELALHGGHGFDGQVANRSGTVGEGRDHPLVRTSMPEIERGTAVGLRALGDDAPAPAAGDAFAAARLHAAFLGAFGAMHLPDAVRSVDLDMAQSQPPLSALLAFAHRLDAVALGRAGLPPADARVLIDSLREFMAGHAAWLADRLAVTRAHVADGSGFFFERIRQMRQAASGRG